MGGTVFDFRQNDPHGHAADHNSITIAENILA